LATRSLEESTARILPNWLTLDPDGLRGSVSRLPEREEMETGINEQLVVEFYSR